MSGLTGQANLGAAQAADVIGPRHPYPVIDKSTYAALDKGHVIKDVLKTSSFTPKSHLFVRYSGKEVQAGSHMKPGEGGSLPQVNWAMDGVPEDSFFTLLMIDPDAPSAISPDRPRISEWLHWAIVNAKTSSTDGEVIMPYSGPSPPRTSGDHRYVFALLRQPRKLDPLKISIPHENRQGFHTADVISKLSLEPWAMSFFLSRND